MRSLILHVSNRLQLVPFASGMHVTHYPRDIYCTHNLHVTAFQAVVYPRKWHSPGSSKASDPTHTPRFKRIENL